MSLVKAIHSAVLKLRLDPNQTKLAQHYFLCGIHSAAATVSQFKDIENTRESLKKELAATFDISDTVARKVAVDAVFEKLRILVDKPATVGTEYVLPPDLTAEEVLNLTAYQGDQTLRDVFHGLWEEGADVSKYEIKYAAMLLNSLKAAGYVRITKP